MEYSRPTIPCRLCGESIDEELAAEDFDAGVPTWDLCDECARLDDEGNPARESDSPYILPA